MELKDLIDTKNDQENSVPNIQQVDLSAKYVIKRNGQKQDVDQNKIKQRLVNLSNGLNLKYINIDVLVNKVYQGIYTGVTTSELDNLAAETCAYMNILHPDYSKLAARVTISNLHKMTLDSFKEVITKLYNYKDKVGRDAPLIATDVYKVIVENEQLIQSRIDYNRDFSYDYFGFKTLEKAYLLKIDNVIVERPQHMLMRVSIGIHLNDLDSAFETYDLMSQLWFTHATPTLFNAGTPKPQMSSCFLLTMKDDSIEGIYDTLKQTAIISKQAGGIGLSIHCIRAQDSYIRGTNGHSNGLVPMLRVFNDTARYVDQGGGKRKGAFAVYLEPWHADVYEVLQMKKNHGNEANRARDLFYALWIPDLFMRRVEANTDWTLMCPNECPGLQDCWGEEFEKLYEKYEQEGRGKKTVKAQWLWGQIIEAQIETGNPYMLYKDSCNRKSNQQNLGTIKSSNLCAEIVEYSSPEEIAVCNLASIALCRFVDDKTREFNYEKLHEVTCRAAKNLNKVIDRNWYPVKEAQTSNMRHRPIGIGVQGFADTLQKMKISFDDPKAKEVNELIFETMYHAAMQTSMEIAIVEGPYETFKGSPLSQGKFQFDLWGITPSQFISKRYDWELLRKQVMQNGVRNSLLISPMPTASTSQILGNNESFEPYQTNVYTRRVLAGEFVCVNPHLVQDLIDLNIWNSDIKNSLLGHNGSIQNIKIIPKHIKELYKTIWEIPQKVLIDLAAQRGPFVCQSQSLNLYLPDPNYSKMTSMHFYAWRSGLKTGLYYLRSRPARDAIKFTVNIEELLKASDTGNNDDILKCLSKDNKQAYNDQNMLKKKKRVEAPNSNKVNGSKTGSNNLVNDKKRKLSDMQNQSGVNEQKESKDSKQEEEEDFVNFECMNCSS